MDKLIFKHKNEIDKTIKTLSKRCLYIPCNNDWYYKLNDNDYERIKNMTHFENNNCRDIWANIVDHIKRIETYEGELDSYYFKLKAELLEYIKKTLLNILNNGA